MYARFTTLKYLILREMIEGQNCFIFQEYPFLLSGFVILSEQIVCLGFSKIKNKSLTAFRESLEKLKIPNKEIDNITKELFDVHGFWGGLWCHFRCLFDEIPVRALTFQNLEF